MSPHYEAPGTTEPEAFPPDWPDSGPERPAEAPPDLGAGDVPDDGLTPAQWAAVELDHLGADPYAPPAGWP